jgi:predicted transcriptional regulator
MEVVMYENSSELAENKLLMLYVLKSIKDPISNTQLTEIILENNFINYFTFQQYLSELEESRFVEYHEANDKKLLILTEKGDSVLSLFKSRISPSKISIIDEYIKEKISSIKKELTIHADYTLGNDDSSFIVDLKAIENQALLMELKLSVPTKNQATLICTKWKNNPSEIYNNVINILIN